jgi:hypothetical protein
MPITCKKTIITSCKTRNYHAVKRKAREPSTEPQTTKVKQKRAKLHLASDFMLHKAQPVDEFQMDSCTSFAPEKNIQEKRRP